MARGKPIGLDIGSMSIRAAEAGRTRDGAVMTRFGQLPLPAGAVQSGVVVNGAAVSTALRSLWSGARFRSKQVILGVTNPQVVVREMKLANLPAAELRKSLPFQVGDQLPLPVERSLLDFYPLENPGTNETVRGLLIAAPKEPVLAAIKAVEGAGLTVARIDLASFALLRATSVLDSQVEAIVEIGAQTTSIVVHADGEPMIVRTVPRGGAEVTAMLATRLRIDAADAEQLKCRIGLLPVEGPETAALVREAIRPLINELRGSFAYLSTASRPRQVARLALSGGGSLLPGLVDALQSDLGVPVAIADPLIRLQEVDRVRPDGLERFRSSAGVSVGLTLGAA